MVSKLIAALAVLTLIVQARADVTVRNCTVVTQIGATASDLHAARELREHLAKITGADIQLRSNAASAPKNSIVVGQGLIARKLFPQVKWDKLGDEQTFLRSKGDVLLVAGGRPRGTLYAVYRLLHVKCGVRWWAPWATTIPRKADLTFGPMDWTETPAFEYRDTFWFHAFDPDWAARNYNTGFNVRTDAAHGGKIEYQGFVHTYYGLVVPEQNFEKHPEWYSLINGKRTFRDAQLCTTNPQMRAYLVEQLRKQLRANPRATIASVSQNDCFNPCQCEVCRAQSAKEGSDAALVLDLANYVGEKVEKEFPNVTIDTLAYQWSRHPTKQMKPRKNVVVRLCSIECNFAFPLSAPENAAFGDDIRGWSKLTNRLYVWDYCTNFANYLQPHPNYFAVGPTLKFFADHGVRGVFEEGAYQSNGGEMAELKAWLIAQMLWDPKQNPDKLIDEFLRGYYGREAAPTARKYLEFWATEAKKVNLTFAMGTQSPLFRYEVLSQAERIWNRVNTMAGDMFSPPGVWRNAFMNYVSLNYLRLTHWREYVRAALAESEPWPHLETRDRFAERWLTLATTRDTNRYRPAPPEWTPITHVNEGGLTPQAFVASLGPEPALPVFHALPARGRDPKPPQGLPAGVDLQDSLANLWQIPDGSELRGDPLASDGIACWMPGDHHEWAFQMLMSKAGVQGRYRIYAVVRCDFDAGYDSPAFSAGVYDNAKRADLMTMRYGLKQVGASYKAYDLGTYDIKPELTVWVAPPSNGKVKAVWIDRIYLVKAN